MHGQKFILGIVLMVLLLSSTLRPIQANWWSFQSIDTMKYSRDPSREYIGNLKALQKMAETQMANIAATGATHVGIATPYDEEFIPVLTTWVEAARDQKLSVWFRGNLSGWEGWFDYPSISRQQHIAHTVEFITNHPELFKDGDVFSACPECENGGPGDPRQTGDIAGHQQFLIDEYTAVNEAFRSIGKNVDTRYNSMNADVAKAVMDPVTTKALGGLVVIDHYVKTPEQLNTDVTEIANLSGGQVVLGEMGAPIPDIHGSLSEQAQAEWLKGALTLLVRNPDLEGLSYWTNIGGSTALWKDSGEAKDAVPVLTSFFSPAELSAKVLNTAGRGIKGAEVQSDKQQTITDSNGSFTLPYLITSEQLKISAPGYASETTSIQDMLQNAKIQLTPDAPSLWYQVQLWFYSLFRNF